MSNYKFFVGGGRKMENIEVVEVVEVEGLEEIVCPGDGCFCC